TRHLSSFVYDRGYKLDGPPQLTSAHSRRLTHFGDDNSWLPIGDAAMSFDPLSGQGILKALLSGIKAAEVATKCPTSSVHAFTMWSEELWKHYTKNRNEYYRMEKRWADQPFWRRRII